MPLLGRIQRRGALAAVVHARRVVVDIRVVAEAMAEAVTGKALERKQFLPSGPGKLLPAKPGPSFFGAS